MVIVFRHNNRTITKTKVGTREGHVTVIKLIRLLVDGMWSLRLWIRRAIGCYKWGLMGHIVDSQKKVVLREM